MINKGIEQRLMELYIKGHITKEELEERLEESDKPDLPEPPPVY